MGLSEPQSLAVAGTVGVALDFFTHAGFDDARRPSPTEVVPCGLLSQFLRRLSSRLHPPLAQVPAEVEACRLSGLAAIKERSPSLDQITLDMESLAVSKANTKVGDTPIKMVVMGEAYLQRDKTDKPNRFVCLLSDKGKVVLTFFTEQ